jgi:hypothetical protein
LFFAAILPLVQHTLCIGSAANDMFTFEQISSQITSTTSNTQIIDYYNNLFKTRVNYYVRQVCGPTTMPNLSTKSVRSTLYKQKHTKCTY